MQLSRRSFIVGTAGAAAVGFGLYSLRPNTPPKGTLYSELKPRALAQEIKYSD